MMSTRAKNSPKKIDLESFEKETAVPPIFGLFCEPVARRASQ